MSRPYLKITDQNVDKVFRYLKMKLKYSKKPKVINYNWIVRKYGSEISYKQVRYIMDRFVELGILEKFSAWDKLNHRQNWYRLPKVN